LLHSGCLKVWKRPNQRTYHVRRLWWKLGVHSAVFADVLSGAPTRRIIMSPLH
jgi:hypothetical protein